MFKKIVLLAALTAVLIFIFVFPSSSAEITDFVGFVSSVGDEMLLRDDSFYTYTPFGEGDTLDITSDEPISCVYMKFYSEAALWNVVLPDKTVECGINGYLHEAVMLDGVSSIRIVFPEGAVVAEVLVYGEGELPDDVQFWSEPHERADILLLSTHSDDEHLFFAGIIPYYAGEMKYNVQVVYLTNHNYTPVRLHEQLDGLWCAGERNYPVIGEFPDLYSESLQGALDSFAQYGFSYDYDSVVEFQVEILRRFKPKVVVGHDVNGEYSHGQHILNTATLIDALPLAADPEAYPKSATLYGTWDTPKTYIHLWDLWGETQIVMNWDVKLDAFGGKSAYQVSCDAFGYHKSQHWTWFHDWLLNSDGSYKASVFEIPYYSPCYYGLYRSTVGADVNKNDMFENLVPYAEENPPVDPPPAGDSSEFDSDASSGIDSDSASGGDFSESSEIGSDGSSDFSSENFSPTETSSQKPDEFFNYPVLIAAVIVLCAIVCAVVIAASHPRRKKKKRKSR